MLAMMLLRRTCGGRAEFACSEQCFFPTLLSNTPNHQATTGCKSDAQEAGQGKSDPDNSPADDDGANDDELHHGPCGLPDTLQVVLDSDVEMEEAPSEIVAPAEMPQDPQALANEGHEGSNDRPSSGKDEHEMVALPVPPFDMDEKSELVDGNESAPSKGTSHDQVDSTIEQALPAGDGDDPNNACAARLARGKSHLDILIPDSQFPFGEGDMVDGPGDAEEFTAEDKKLPYVESGGSKPIISDGDLASMERELSLLLQEEKALIFGSK